MGLELPDILVLTGQTKSSLLLCLCSILELADSN